MSAAVSIDNLTFTYRETERPALSGISGQIEDGTYAVVMGHGGAGKSTLCYSLNALVPRFFHGDYSGTVAVKGQLAGESDVAQMSHLLGLVLQDFESQLFSTSVELEVAFGPENHCVPREEIEERIQTYLEFVGLSHARKREPASLSGGQKQRLAIASVLALQPQVLVMDEATTDLDPIGREEVLSVADTLRRQRRTLIVVDHEPETAEDADQVWLMRDGEIMSQGPPADVLTDLQALETCGVKPPPTVELFQAMGWPGRPLTLEGAQRAIETNHLADRRALEFEREAGLHSDRPAILATTGLSYTYETRSVQALREVSLDIHERDFVAILGQNGSGKTTLAKHFNGLLEPSQGEVLVAGRPAADMSRVELARIVGYVFQNPDHQIFANTVREEVGFSLKMAGLEPDAVEKRVGEALEVVGLPGYEDEVPFVLTKGQRQRVAVASILATQPQVIILDEPTTGLDYRSQRSMMNMLTSLNRQGHTIIIITHSMWVASEYAERAIILKDGAVALDGPTRAVFAEEDKLAETALRPPTLLRLGNWLGTRSLTLEKMVEELRGR
jgi:energy-coupling factor transporter ATP-binding protein EcfA2